MQGWANDTALMTQRGQSMIRCVCVCVPLPSPSLQLLPNLLHRTGLMTQCGQRLPRRSIGTAVYVCVCLDKPQLMKCGTKTPSQIPQYNDWSLPGLHSTFLHTVSEPRANSLYKMDLISHVGVTRRERGTVVHMSLFMHWGELS